MSNRSHLRPLSRLSRFGAHEPIYGADVVPVEESKTVRHPCGHEVLWRLLPGVAADWPEVRGVFAAPCPCCGGEVGPDAWRARTGKPCPEWPDHVAIARLGVAHCHSPEQPCAEVNQRHRAGLA